MPDPITRYDHLVSAGTLRPDEHQRNIIQQLQRLWNDLKDYDPGPLPPESAPEPASFVSGTNFRAGDVKLMGSSADCSNHHQAPHSRLFR